MLLINNFLHDLGLLNKLTLLRDEVVGLVVVALDDNLTALEMRAELVELEDLEKVADSVHLLAFLLAELLAELLALLLVHELRVAVLLGDVLALRFVVRPDAVVGLVVVGLVVVRLVVVRLVAHLDVLMDAHLLRNLDLAALSEAFDSANRLANNKVAAGDDLLLFDDESARAVLPATLLNLEEALLGLVIVRVVCPRGQGDQRCEQED